MKPKTKRCPKCDITSYKEGEAFECAKCGWKIKDQNSTYIDKISPLGCDEIAIRVISNGVTYAGCLTEVQEDELEEV
jgi:hypothetical protein